jgi:hypothetical protein
MIRVANHAAPLGITSLRGRLGTAEQAAERVGIEAIRRPQGLKPSMILLRLTRR